MDVGDPGGLRDTGDRDADTFSQDMFLQVFETTDEHTVYSGEYFIDNFMMVIYLFATPYQNVILYYGPYTL